jgi:DNA-directed RNA polymerase subunit RPC12/RpoP
MVASIIDSMSLIRGDRRKHAMVNEDKYSRTVSLLCPTCGSDQFEYEGDDETVEEAKCAKCGRQFTKDELIEENAENLDQHMREIGQEAIADVEKEFHNTLKKVFRGSKYIKVR